MENRWVPGFFLVEDVNFVKHHAGPQGVEKLQVLIPELNLKKISSIKRYSLDEEIKLLTAVAKVVYGNDSTDSWEKLGWHEFDTISGSSLGKVLLSLWGGSFEFLIKNGGRMFAFFAPFVTYSTQNLTPTEADIIIEKDPYPKEYYRGVFRSIFKRMCGVDHVIVEDAGGGKHIYHISIKPASA